jgi:hypothetical protein
MKRWNSSPHKSQVGRTRVGGVDFNKARMRHVTEAVIALSASLGGFTASQLAAPVRDCGESAYESRASMQGVFRERDVAA